MSPSTAGARHLAESAQWIAHQQEERERTAIAFASRYINPSFGFGSLIQSAAMHDADPVQWIQRFIL